MLGTELRTWRKRNRMTQDALRMELEVSRQTIVAWEQSDKPLPRLTELALIALEQVPGCKVVDGYRQTATQYLEQRARAAHSQP
jgi:DNA-binding XRE family transcriptional regulator